MKILLNCHVPFMLAHGGAQIQIEQTWAALKKIGVDVEYLRWWDATQTGDVLHHFGRIPLALLFQARAKGMKVVMLDLLTGQGSRSHARLRSQKWTMQVLKRILPASLTDSVGWNSYRLVDACIANTAWEKQLMSELFGAPPEKVHVVPNGVEDVFLQSQPVARGPWLVCTVTITPRKRVLELARAAVHAQTPLWIIGKPYSDSDPYAASFFQLARENQKILRYEGPIDDRKKLADVYRAARGFVLISTMETRSLSAEEAAACQCPLLLSDLPWAHNVFGGHATYCPNTDSIPFIAASLRSFYDRAPNLNPPPKPLPWTDVARQFLAVYETVLSTSR